MEAWPIVWRLFPAAWFLAGAAGARSSITITVDTQAAGVAIPADFLERNGEHLFGPGNKALIARFRRLGGDGNLMSCATARDTMLSRAWIESYDRLYNWFAVTALSHGSPYGRKKTNNFTGGAKDAPDTFTAELWALDYIHWWAVHGASNYNAAAKEGITLGGESIDDGAWDDNWTPLDASKSGQGTLEVRGGSAAIVRLSLEKELTVLALIP